MNSRNRNLYLLAAAALVLAGCKAGRRYESTVSRRWPAAGIERLHIREVDGSVDVVAADVNEIALTARIDARGTAPDHKAENEGYFSTSIDGNTLEIGRKSTMRVGLPFFHTNDVRISYTLTVPRTVALEVKTVNGRIVSRGIDGESDFSSVNGPIEIETSGENELSATAVNGGVLARFNKTFQGAMLKTVNGRVQAILPPSASFVCDLSQVNGDFEASFPLSIRSNPGSRRVSGEVNGGKYELKIMTVNGDIRVDNGSGRTMPQAMPAPPEPPDAPDAPDAPEPPDPPDPPESPNPTS
ncbi:MAG TPA: DUF4097 family beta strand repeat-containing protein [Thermoanaerobaculia bacterium]|nr:DUF4097 family beta strand repeat-containing protein [Thermoanaerobaculia bacterium]